MMLGLGLSLTLPRGAGWTPESLGASLYDYWDAEIASTLSTSGSAVTAWRSAKNAYSAAQGLGAARPLYSATSFNGRPGLTFDGADDELTYAGVGNFPTGANACEMWALVDQNVAPADATTRTWAGYGANTATFYRRLYRSVATGVNRAGTQVGTGGGGPVSVNLSVDYSGRHVHRAVISSTAFQTEVDGVAGPSQATIPATGTTRTRIGATPDDTASAFGKGVISAVFITAPLTSDQAAQMYLYLKARGSIA